ncbi:MAG: hypothetical protein KJ737_15715 [Proteobacteria bacterium]|nr:hypothetical protein [Pseudomonadota bacterium]
MSLRQFSRGLMTTLIFVLIMGCSNGSTNDPGITVSEPVELKSATISVENAFLSGVPTNVLTTMSDESKAFYEADIDNIEALMVDFGNDFKNRKLMYSTDNYAEYEFTAKNETNTVTFSKQDDGSWKLTRF